MDVKIGDYVRVWTVNCGSCMVRESVTTRLSMVAVMCPEGDWG